MQQQQQQLVRDPYKADEGQFAQFARGLAAVLNQWTALHLVAQYCDKQALLNVHNDLLNWFQRNGEVYADELEDYFEDFFNSARSVLIEDGSIEEVSGVLHEMYCHCCNNDFSRVEQFVQSEVVFRQTNPVAMSVNAGGGGGVDGDEEEITIGYGQYATLEEAAAAAAASGEDGLYPTTTTTALNEEEEGQEGGASPAVAGQEDAVLSASPLQQQQQQQAPAPKPKPQQQRKKKNAYVRSNDGWNTVQ